MEGAQSPHPNKHTTYINKQAQNTCLCKFMNKNAMSVNNIFISKQNFIYRVMVSRLAFAPAESLSLQFREVEQSHSWHNGDASLPLPRSHGAKNNPKSSHLFTLRAEVVEGGRGEDRVVCPPATVVVKFTRTRGTQTNSRLKGRGFCRRPFQVQKSSTH